MGNWFYWRHRSLKDELMDLDLDNISLTERWLSEHLHLHFTVCNAIITGTVSGSPITASVKLGLFAVIGITWLFRLHRDITNGLRGMYDGIPSDKCVQKREEINMSECGCGKLSTAFFALYFTCVLCLFCILAFWLQTNKPVSVSVSDGWVRELSGFPARGFKYHSHTGVSEGRHQFYPI